MPDDVDLGNLRDGQILSEEVFWEVLFGDVDSR
jgi:hypothetical protein